MNIEQRIADVIRQKQVAFGREDEVATAIAAVLGLRLSGGGHYVAYDVELTDDERDRAGFTHHRT